MADLYVNWQKNPVDGSWFKLRRLDYESLMGSGIYLIWYSGIDPRVVYVGQGLFSNRLSEHLHSLAITRYEAKGHLFTTWAEVDKRLRDGVERYLIDTYDPLENIRKPNAPPIGVNLLVR